MLTAKSRKPDSCDSEIQNPSDKILISACGLYCGTCGINLATHENDIEKILQYAVVLNQTFDETLCDGCGANRKSLHCSKMCTFIDCKQQKGVNFCIDCIEFPCQALLDFKSKMPHRIEIIESMKRLKEIGNENWIIEMKKHFSCPKCNALNSAYDIQCRKCGNSPGCKFVAEHREMIDKYLSQ